MNSAPLTVISAHLPTEQEPCDMKHKPPEMWGRVHGRISYVATFGIRFTSSTVR